MHAIRRDYTKRTNGELNHLKENICKEGFVNLFFC